MRTSQALTILFASVATLAPFACGGSGSNSGDGSSSGSSGASSSTGGASGGGSGSSGGSGSGGSNGSGGGTSGSTSGGASSSTGGSSSTGSGGGSSSSSGTSAGSSSGSTAGTHIKTVFVILMENSDWSSIQGNSSAPYINSLLTSPHASYCAQYFNAPNLHPSEPNYVWLEAATNTFPDVTFTQDDSQITSANTTSAQHLATLMTAANVTWREYAEGVDGTSCPLSDSAGSGDFYIRHIPYVFFQDVVGNPPSPTNQTCIQHIRPYTELQGDLTNNKVAQYNFITPNGMDDGHDSDVATQDGWLKQQVPMIMASQAYTDGGVIFITWDECNCPNSPPDTPIGMIAVSPFAKGNTASTKMVDHSSLVRTTEEIFGLMPYLNNAANASDLSDLFSTFP